MIKKKNKIYDTLTNRTTRHILQCLFDKGIYAWRHNVLPVPMVREGVVVGFRPGSKAGLPDIMGIIPPWLFAERGNAYGVPIWIEIKTGKDRLRPEQLGAHKNARRCGAFVLVVKDIPDFDEKFSHLPLIDGSNKQRESFNNDQRENL